MTQHAHDVPMRRRLLRTGFGAGLALAAGVSLARRLPADGDWRERTMQGLGTTLWLRAASSSGARTERGLDAAVAAIRRVERTMSLFDPRSQLCQLNRDGELTAPDPWLVQVLELARFVAAQSDGAFDPTVQPLWLVWDAARRAGRRPDAAQITRARALIDWRAVLIERTRVRFERPGMGMTLNGIAQGFAADMARAALLDAGVSDALIDAGEWAPIGRAPGGKPWTLGLADPQRADGGGDPIARVQPDNERAIATSAGAVYRFTADGSDHHILDPHTGHSPHGLRLVSVLAGRCAVADALTKVFYMTPAAKHAALAAAWSARVLPGGGGSSVDAPVDVLSVDDAGVIRQTAGVVA